MKTEVKLVGIMALATTGLMTMSYLEEQDVPVDLSVTSEPAARNEYLTKRFPQFDSELNKLSIKAQSPDKIWKDRKNEWHSLYELGECSKLRESWSKSLASSFGNQDKWGIVQTATAPQPISIFMRVHPEYVHIFMVEYNPSHFADKPWYKSWRTSPSDVKSSYVMSVNCESLIKDRTP